MKLKLACADFAFPLLAHNKVLKLISMLEFDGVDIGLFEGRSHLQPSNMFKDLRKNARELSGKLDDLGLKPADIFLMTSQDFTALAPNHPDRQIREKERELYLNAIEFTAECKGKHVTSIPGVYFEEESREASYERCCKELYWRCEQAKKFGIVFSVEPHLGSIVPTPQEALELVKSVDGLTVTLDYGHFTNVGIADEAIESLIPHASHFHARGATKGLLQASLKNNTIDYIRILKQLKKADYKGYVGIEYVWIDWQHCNEVDNLSETILLRDFLLMEYGKLK